MPRVVKVTARQKIYLLLFGRIESTTINISFNGKNKR